MIHRAKAIEREREGERDGGKKGGENPAKPMNRSNGEKGPPRVRGPDSDPVASTKGVVGSWRLVEATK